MKLLGIGVVVLHLGFAAVPAWAERTELLYEFGNWVVEGVTGDDYTYACRARVSTPGNSFAIRLFPDETVRLQFRSVEWDLGEGDTAGLQVGIDSRSPWSFAGATLLQDSVFVDMLDPEESKDFVRQVAKGQTLYLRSEKGTDIRSYSLLGSSEAVRNMGACDQATVRDRNPFN